MQFSNNNKMDFPWSVFFCNFMFIWSSRFYVALVISWVANGQSQLPYFQSDKRSFTCWLELEIWQNSIIPFLTWSSNCSASLGWTKVYVLNLPILNLVRMNTRRYQAIPQNILPVTNLFPLDDRIFFTWLLDTTKWSVAVSVYIRRLL